MGVTAGAAYSGLSDYPQNAHYVLEREWGAASSFLFNQRLTGCFSIEITPGILARNYARRRREPYQSIFHRYQNLYLSLPITLQAGKSYGAFTFYLEAGMFMAYRIRAKETGVVPNVFNSVVTTGPDGIEESVRLVRYKANVRSEDDIRNTDWSILVGSGGRYQLNKSFGLSIGLSYAQSITQRNRKNYNGDNAGYNNSIIAKFGLLYFPWKRLSFNQ